MIEDMSVVVNVMLSLMNVMGPRSAWCNLLVRTVKLCTLRVFCFRGELHFLNCDDICICVENKQFELIELAPNDTTYRPLCKLCRNLLPPAMRARLYFFCMSVMQTRWMAGTAPHQTGQCRALSRSHNHTQAGLDLRYLP